MAKVTQVRDKYALPFFPEFKASQAAGSTMSRLHRPPYVDPATNICYDTTESDYEGWLTKQSMWLKVRAHGELIAYLNSVTSRNSGINSSSSSPTQCFFPSPCLLAGLAQKIFRAEGVQALLPEERVRVAPRDD